MAYADLIQKLGFKPKENFTGVFRKDYALSYFIEVDFDHERINYGRFISSDNKTTQNFSQAENWVVLECVDRLLEKGYLPKNIILEKVYRSGHGTSGRLDILVNRDDGTAYLMIECKTYGAEFEKATKRLLKDGGQLFTYFQQDKNSAILMLYASALVVNEIVYKNEIVKIEDDYRQTGNVPDFYDRWNKLPRNNGVFDEWVNPYDFQSKALTPRGLKDITQEDSSFIFNQFLEILRHNVVSDKPNAFNKIFTLFLCKIYDEKATKPHDELAFQWLEGKDGNISFQKRLTDLYKKGMKEFLEKEVTDLSDEDFEKKFKGVDEPTKQLLLDEFTKIRLKKNNEFAIKEVFDDDSFDENAKVVKEVVELLQGFKIRYTKKQQYLSDFFEMLLTTGLKQESGQFFTPVPIAQFIIKSIPIDKLVHKKLSTGETNNLLPIIIDYAAGSGHFITESMHEVQRIIDQTDPSDFIDATARKIKTWKQDHFDWALQYIYGIEKDYRLVKVGKVGCYLHGDGLAKIVHSDGLGSFAKNDEFKDFLKKADHDFPQDNKQFDICVSNPPYSVSAFKNNARKYYTEEDFKIYDRLTDQSSEIECLFIERTKQLLKDGGIAGIILPSSILSNTGIYTRAREIILKYFDIVAIAELGSNTFMATGTNTVTLFLRRRNNYDHINVRKSVENAVADAKDVTINGIEKSFSKYVAHVWEGISFADYSSLLKKQPNDAVKNHEIYQEYQKKINAKADAEKWQKIIEIEIEKLFYFILAYKQKIVLVKSGEKQAEKDFLGYYFSHKRGNEGIHPIQRGKAIDECTQLFDSDVFDNPEKASTYIYQAFNGDFETTINEKLTKHIARQNLVDMFTFDRFDFEKEISLAVKKKIKIETKWDLVRLGDISDILNGGTPDTKNQDYWDGDINWATLADTKDKYLFDTKKKITLEGVKKSSAVILPVNTVIFSSRATIGDICINKVETCTNQGYKNFVCDEDKIHQEYLYHILKNQAKNIATLASGMTYPEISKSQISDFKIPLPPKDVQEKIVAEIEVLEAKEAETKTQIEKLNQNVNSLISNSGFQSFSLKNVLQEINPGKKDATENLDLNTKVSFLSMADVSNDGLIINIQKRKLKDVKNGFTFFQENDVLVAKITPCMENGKGAFVGELENNLGFGSTEFFVLRSNPQKILPKILFYITRTKDFRQSAEKEMTGTSGHRRVPKAFIERYNIQLPPLEEQKKIVSQIKEIETKIADLENEISAIPQQKESVLKKYL